MVRITAARWGALSSLALSAFVHGTRTIRGSLAKTLGFSLSKFDRRSVVGRPRQLWDASLSLACVQREYHCEPHLE